MANDKSGANASAGDTEKLLSDLESDNRGKDKKITELVAALKAAEEKAAAAEAAAQGRGQEDADAAGRLAELAIRLSEREKDLDLRGKALNLSIEKGVPFALIERGKDDLDGWVKELGAFQRDTIERFRGAKPIQKPAEKMGFDDYRKLSKDELSRFPRSLLDKLIGGKA